jgi:hypothetical protein
MGFLYHPFFLTCVLKLSDENGTESVFCGFKTSIKNINVTMTKVESLYCTD